MRLNFGGPNPLGRLIAGTHSLPIVVALLILCISSCSTSRQQEEPALHQLTRAYDGNSVAAAEVFFNNWYTRSTSANLDRLSPHNEALYQVYKQFYRKEKGARGGRDSINADCGKGPAYFVIPSRMPYGIFDTLHTGTLRRMQQKGLKQVQVSEDTLANFRPALSLPQRRVLHLYPNYEKVLLDFLGTSHESQEEEWRKRKAFLCGMIRIRRGHLGTWEIASDPRVNRILLEEDLERAKVMFMSGHRGGYALFDRSEGTWQLIEQRLTVSE